MSTSLLLVGAIATFLAVFAIAYSVQSIVAERRQAYRTLQAIRAVELRPADLRTQAAIFEYLPSARQVEMVEGTARSMGIDVV